MTDMSSGRPQAGTAPGGNATAPAEPVRRPALVLVAALLGEFCALLDVTIVNVALPTMGRDLDASLRGLEWVTTAYLLALAVFIVTAGRLGDVYGRRGIYLWGSAIFAVGSLVCAGASTVTPFGVAPITVLHAGRVVQGIGGAVVIPVSLAIIYVSFEGRQRQLGIVLWGAAGGLATALGPLIGGLLVTHVGWESIFLLNLPLEAVALATAAAGLGRSRRLGGRRSPLDLGGLVTIALTLLLLNLALINGNDWGWTAASTLSLFAGSVVAAGAFLAVESHSAFPIMTIAWFRRPGYAGSVLASLLLGTGVFAMIFYLSLYLQTALDLTAIGTGLRLLPTTVTIIPGAPLGGILARRVGQRMTLVGAFGLLTVGLLLLTRIDVDGGDAFVRLLPGMLVCGLALGAAIPLVTELTISAAPPGQTGVASSVGTMVRQIGNAGGVAIMGAILQSRVSTAGSFLSSGAGPQTATATRDMAWFAVAVTAAAVVVVLALVRDPDPSAAAASPAPAAAPALAAAVTPASAEAPVPSTPTATVTKSPRSSRT